jgi:hypothetical protein
MNHNNNMWACFPNLETFTHSKNHLYFHSRMFFFLFYPIRSLICCCIARFFSCSNRSQISPTPEGSRWAYFLEILGVGSCWRSRCWISGRSEEGFWKQTGQNSLYNNKKVAIMFDFMFNIISNEVWYINLRNFVPGWIKGSIKVLDSQFYGPIHPGSNVSTRGGQLTEQVSNLEIM